jgi:hypothetical protein
MLKSILTNGTLIYIFLKAKYATIKPKIVNMLRFSIKPRVKVKTCKSTVKAGRPMLYPHRKFSDPAIFSPVVDPELIQ